MEEGQTPQLIAPMQAKHSELGPWLLLDSGSWTGPQAFLPPETCTVSLSKPRLSRQGG